MGIHVLDTVELLKDLPEHNLHHGARGAVLQVYGAEEVEVEFVELSGLTQAVVMLRMDEVRGIGSET